jgi:hypothetical protein
MFLEKKHLEAGVINEKQVAISESTCSGVFGTSPKGQGGTAIMSIDTLSQVPLAAPFRRFFFLSLSRPLPPPATDTIMRETDKVTAKMTERSAGRGSHGSSGCVWGLGFRVSGLGFGV